MKYKSTTVAMATRHCFVPHCKNNSKKCPEKIFVRIREDLRKKWCQEVNATHFSITHTKYCCEDHIDPYEDLKNYHKHKLMNDEPMLKPTAKLRNITPRTPRTKTNEIKPLSTGLVFEDEIIDSLDQVIKIEKLDLKPDYIECDSDGYIEITDMDERTNNGDLLVDSLNYDT